MSSKLKELIDSLESNLFSFVCPPRLLNSHIVIKPKISLFVRILRYALGMTILIPGFVYCFSIGDGEMVFENFKSLQVAEQVSSPQEFMKTGVGPFTFRETSVVSKVNDFTKKSVSKLRGGLIKIFSSQNGDGGSSSETSTQDSTAEASYHSSNSTDDCDFFRAHEDYPMWLGYYLLALPILFTISGFAGGYVYFRFFDS